MELLSPAKLKLKFVQTGQQRPCLPLQYKLDRETAASSYDLYVPTLGDNGQIEDEYIQEIMDRWRQQTGSSASVPLDRTRDFSLVREVVGELGLP